jgi:hypothetical protein
VRGADAAPTPGPPGSTGDAGGADVALADASRNVFHNCGGTVSASDSRADGASAAVAHEAPWTGWRLPALSPLLLAGDGALLPADFADLDGDGDTAEALSVDLLGRPRAPEGATVATSQQDIGAILSPLPQLVIGEPVVPPRTSRSSACRSSSRGRPSATSTGTPIAAS